MVWQDVFMSVCPSGPVLPCLFISSSPVYKKVTCSIIKLYRNVFKVATLRSKYLNYFCPWQNTGSIYLWGFLLNCTVFSSKLCCLDFHHDQLVDVEEYRLHIHESGEDFNETLRIDEEEQTELFKVPAHRNIEKSDIMFDFKMVSN